MKHRFKALLFDLDGTLIDSLPDLQATLNTLLRQEGRRELTSEEVMRATGDGLEAQLERGFAATGMALTREQVAALIPRWLAIYAEIVPQPSCIYPGMLDFLQNQKQAGIRMAVCTNKRESASVRILQQLDLDGYFSAVIGGDTLPERKPHPLPLLHALEKLGVGAKDAVMIGDGPNDCMAAAAAGIPCIIVRYGHAASWPGDLVPVAFIDHPNELLHTIAGIRA
jgi:phosphoglycolate phosphatase